MSTLVGCIKKIAILCWYFFASLIILAAITGVALQALTPVLNDHKADIEKYARQRLHVKVSLAHVKADWARLGPEIHFSGVVLRSLDNAKAPPILEVDDLSIQLGILGTLLHRSLYFSSLTVSGLHLDVAEVGLDQYQLNHVLMLDLSDHSVSHFPDFLAWLLTQNTILLSHVKLDLRSLHGDKIALDLDHANVHQLNKENQKKRLSLFIDGKFFANFMHSHHEKKIQSHMSLYTWIDLDRQNLRMIEAEWSLRDLLLEKGDRHKSYPSFEGAILWQPKGNDWVLDGEDIVLTQSSQEKENYVFSVWSLPDHYAVKLNVFDLSQGISIADFFDLFPQKLDVMSLKLKGKIKDLTAYVPKKLSAWDQYQFSGAFEDVGAMAYQMLPAIQHLSGVFSGTMNAGDFYVSDTQDEIDFPQYFDAPLALDNISVRGGWSKTVDHFFLLLDTIDFKSANLSAQAALSLEIPSDSSRSPQLALLAAYDLKKSQAATSFLPMKLFDVDFARWLREALVSGEGGSGKVLIQGPISAFPYAHQEGVFIVDSALKPMTVLFSKEWPAMHQASGHLYLHNQRFEANVVGQSQGLSLQANVDVPDYQADHVILHVDAKARGDVKNYLNYIHASPLHATLEQWLSPFSLTGKGDLSLHVTLPLDQLDEEHSRVVGEWLWHQGTFLWQAAHVKLEAVNGLIHFTQNDFYINSLKANFFGEPLTLELKTQAKNGSLSAIDIKAAGNFSNKQLQKIFQWDTLSSYMLGQSYYHASMHIPLSGSRYDMSFQSDLKGISLILPGSLAKLKDAQTPFSLSAVLDVKEDALSLFARYLKKTEISLMLRNFFQESVKQKSIDVGMNAEVLVAHGKIVLPNEKNPILRADFNDVWLASQKTQSSSSSSSLKAITLATWPELLLNVQRFRLGKQVLGYFSLHTSPRKEGVSFDAIEIKNPLYQLLAHGQWLELKQQDQTAFQGTFATKNVGKFLSDTNIAQNLQAQSGKANFSLHWLGSPLDAAWKRLQGEMTLEAKDGVIPVSGDAAKMGLGKVLSLFSAQSIQRRLQFNFSDLGEEGYSFNTFHSMLNFQSGEAQVKQGEFDGPEAKIAFNGQIGLSAQTYHLNLIVTPYVTSTLPFIATLAGGPIAGVATYAFDKIAEKGIAKFTSYHYLLVGPWSQPKLIDLDAQAKTEAAARQAKLDEKNVAPVQEAQAA